MHGTQRLWFISAAYSNTVRVGIEAGADSSVASGRAGFSCGIQTGHGDRLARDAVFGGLHAERVYGRSAGEDHAAKQ